MVGWPKRFSTSKGRQVNFSCLGSPCVPHSAKLDEQVHFALVPCFIVQAVNDTGGQRIAARVGGPTQRFITGRRDCGKNATQLLAQKSHHFATYWPVLRAADRP